MCITHFIWASGGPSLPFAVRWTALRMGAQMSWLGRLMGGTRAAPLIEAVVEVEPDFVVIDVETACSDYGSICQVGVVGFAGSREVLAWEQLVDPRQAFDAFNVRLHGIDEGRVRGAPDFRGVHRQIRHLLGGRVAVAHSGFDRVALRRACEDCELDEIEARWLDSVGVARIAWPELPNHKLSTLAAHLSLPLDHHDALSDARAAGLVMLKAMEKTGASLDDWFSHRRRAELRAPAGAPPNFSAARKPAGEGALSGHRVVITGTLSVSREQMADRIAQAGGRVGSTLAPTTTLLVLGEERGGHSAKHKKALALREAGGDVRIVSEGELQAMLQA